MIGVKRMASEKEFLDQMNQQLAHMTELFTNKENDFDSIMNELNNFTMGLVTNHPKPAPELIQEYQNYIDEMLRIAKSYEGNYEQLKQQMLEKTSHLEYASGGECIHRGYLCPSPILDQVIGGCNRGKLIRKPRANSKSYYVYHFNDKENLIGIEKYSNGTCYETEIIIEKESVIENESIIEKGFLIEEESLINKESLIKKESIIQQEFIIQKEPIIAQDPDLEKETILYGITYHHHSSSSVLMSMEIYDQNQRLQQYTTVMPDNYTGKGHHNIRTSEKYVYNELSQLQKVVLVLEGVPSRGILKEEEIICEVNDTSNDE